MYMLLHYFVVSCCLSCLSRRYHDLAAKDEGQVLYDTFVQRCKVLQWLHALCMTGLNILHSPKGINVASPPALYRVHAWLHKLQLLWKVYYMTVVLPKLQELAAARPSKVFAGTYGNRQVLSMNTNGPFTHVFYF